MRHVWLTVLMLGAASTAFAQQERTLFEGNLDVAGFGGPEVRYTRIADQDGLMLGARGGVILNRSIVLSGAGWGMVTEIDSPPNSDGSFDIQALTDIRFGYGGFQFEYLVKPDAVAHVGLSALVGGGATQRVFDRPGRDGFRDDDDNRIGDPDGFFVFEPGVNLEVNVMRWLHMSGGVSYRIVNGVERPNLSNDDLSGISATFGVKFIRR
jgi:hypothetical protein